MTIGLLGAPCSGDVNFGPTYTGLATVSYKLVAADKSTLQDWTTSGVTEVETGSGIYMVAWTSTFFSTTLAAAVQVGKIRWRTASSNGVYASDDLDIRYPADVALSTVAAYIDTEVAAIKAKTDLIPAGGPPSAADYTSARAAKLDKLVGDTRVLEGAE